MGNREESAQQNAVNERWHNAFALRVFLGFLVAGVLVIADADMFVRPLYGSAQGIAQTIVPAAVAFSVTCLLYAFLGMLLASMSHRGARLGGVTAALALAVSFLLRSNGFDGIELVICGAVFGIGLGVASISWCVLLSSLGEKNALRTVSWALLIGSCLKTLMLAFSGVSLVLATVACFALTSGIPRAGAKEKTAAKEEPDPKPRGMFRRNWIVYCAFLLCITVIAGVWSDVATFNPKALAAAQPVSIGMSLGLCLGSAALVIMVEKRDLGDLRPWYLTVPLVCVGILLIVKFLSNETWIGHIVTFAACGISTVACCALGMSRLGAEADDNRLSPYLVFGLALAVAAGVFLIWFGVWPFLEEPGARALDLTLKVAYLVAAGVQTLLLVYRQPSAISSLGESSTRDTCAEIVQTFQLSNRESEILRLLAQGRSSAYIAEEQFVSVNTVNTHVKRIYEKTGVHSRQELLDLIHKS